MSDEPGGIDLSPLCDRGEVIAITSPEAGAPGDTVVLRISNGFGKEVLRITADRQMHFATDYAPSQQASAFKQAMNLLCLSQHQPIVFPLGE